MNEGMVDRERAVIAHDKSPEVLKPGDAPLDNPALLITSRHAPILRRRPATVRPVWSNQGHATSSQPFAQRIAVVAFVRDHPRGLLPQTPASVPPPHSDRLKRFFHQPDIRRGGRVKVVSQRNTRTVDHHHPLRPLAPLGFAAPRTAAPVSWEARAGSFPSGRRSATNRVAPSALLVALIPLTIHLHRQITTQNLTPCTGF